MSGTPYTVAFGPLIKDPAVAAEFERIQSYWAGLVSGATAAGKAESALNTQQIVTNKSGAGFRLYKSSAQTISNPNTETALTWDVESIDTDFFFPGTGSTITIQVPGTYLITCHISTDSGADPENVLVSLKVNGTEVIRSREHIAWVGQFVGGETLVVYVTGLGDSMVVSKASTTGLEGYQLPASPGSIIPGTGGTGGGGTPQSASVSDFLPTFNARNWWGGRADGNANAYIGIGHATPTQDGASFAVNNQSDSTYRQDQTAAGAAGSIAGIRLTGNVGCQLRHGPTFIAKVRTDSSITGVRIWIGLTQTVPANVDDLGGTSRYVMFRYSTVAGDGGWVGATRDGTTQSVTATVAAIAINSAYLLKIRVSSDGGTVYFSVNGGTEVSATANLPAGTITLGFAIEIVTTDANAKSLNISRHSCIFGT